MVAGTISHEENSTTKETVLQRRVSYCMRVKVKDPKKIFLISVSVSDRSGVGGNREKRKAKSRRER